MRTTDCLAEHVAAGRLHRSLRRARRSGGDQRRRSDRHLDPRPDIAPRGVGYQPPLQERTSRAIQNAIHPFITGEGFGGEPLGASSFTQWNPTDRGFLSDRAGGRHHRAARRRGQPTMIEYNYGAGKVIVTTLTFCTPGQPNSMGDALDNLLKYGRFYSGVAQTPAPSVTPTSTPTDTRTPTPDVHRQATRRRPRRRPTPRRRHPRPPRRRRRSAASAIATTAARSR